MLVLLLSAAVRARQPRTSLPARTTAPAAQGRTLVVLGASDAYGVGTSDPDRDNWPTSLSRQLRGHDSPRQPGRAGHHTGARGDAGVAHRAGRAARRGGDVAGGERLRANVPLATYSSQLRSAIHHPAGANTRRESTSPTCPTSPRSRISRVVTSRRWPRASPTGTTPSPQPARGRARRSWTSSATGKSCARIQSTSAATGYIHRRLARSGSPRFSARPSSRASSFFSRQGATSS